MGIAPSHFEEHQQREEEEEEQSAKALMMMNAHHARSISRFWGEIPSDLECTICAEVRVYSFVSEITFLLGVTCFSRARARAASRARREEKKRVRESVRGAFACGDSRDDVRPMRRALSLSLFSLFFSLSEKARDFQSI